MEGSAFYLQSPMTACSPATGHWHSHTGTRVCLNSEDHLTTCRAAWSPPAPSSSWARTGGCPPCSEDGSCWRAPLTSAALEDVCSLLRVLSMCLSLARGLSGKEPGGPPRPCSCEGVPLGARSQVLITDSGSTCSGVRGGGPEGVPPLTPDHVLYSQVGSVWQGSPLPPFGFTKPSGEWPP